MARRRLKEPSGAADMVLPRDLMSHAYPDLYAAFTRVMPDGRLGTDPAASPRNFAAEADRKRRFEAWFEDRGISTKFADRDGRFEEVLGASRTHWGLNHQGEPRQRRQ